MKKIFIAITLLLSSTTYARTIHVILDPGHGGPADFGINTAGFDEKTTTLDLAKKVQIELEKDEDFEVVLSRIGDYPVTPNDRRKTGNQYEDAIFISLHAAAYDKEPQVTTFVLKQATWNQNSILTPIEFVHGKQNKNSMKLAKIFDEEFPENLNHRILVSRFALTDLIGIQAPAALVECQCMLPSQQATTNANLEEFARNIAEGIQIFAKKVL